MLKIKELLKDKELTVIDIAEKLGITRETVARQINGNPTIETLQRYADVLGVEISDLFIRKKNPALFECPHCHKPLKIELK